ncbi:MAG: zinc-ribbon domain-containing protein [Candidatus Magnetomorum sp.]|nr:zinc-ribbon domain-containing protein [Candidatus Magnetomorum sp.]
MQIICQECKGKFRIADEKIPENKAIHIACPKCKKKIHIQGKPKEILIDPPMNDMEAFELPFEVLGDEQTALVCLPSNDGQSIIQDLTKIGYKTVQAKNSKDAMKMIRFHPFNIAVIDETFDLQANENDHILSYLKLLPMSSRRNLFVAWVSDTYRTNDHMGAYCQSVNLIVNRNQTPEFKTVVQQAVKENESFYSVYKESISKFQ